MLLNAQNLENDAVSFVTNDGYWMMDKMDIDAGWWTLDHQYEVIIG